MIRLARKLANSLRRLWREPSSPAGPVPSSATTSLGGLGEAIAAHHLESAGLRIIERNARTRSGELDLIALDPSDHVSTVVFVEVKTRRSQRSGAPEDAVTRTKMNRLTRGALAFLASHPRLRDQPCRFDVVAIEAPPGVPLETLAARPDLLTIRWTRNAFEVEAETTG